MAPESRRETIIDAAIELVERDGAAVPTREIAAHAGIAEGTLFRVFPTKADLIKAVVTKATDPARLVRQLDTVDLSLPLEDRIGAILTAISSSIGSVQSLMLVARQMKGQSPDCEQATGQMKRFHRPPNPEVFAAHISSVRDSIARIIAPDQDRLSVELTDASSFILMVAVSPMMHFLQPHLSQTALLTLVTRALINKERVHS
jgi:AcrR family transcriptional regulator